MAAAFDFGTQREGALGVNRPTNHSTTILIGGKGGIHSRQFSVDWTNRALVMHGAFCDQPRPDNDPGDDPGLSCTVAIRRTRFTPCACPMFYDDVTFFCDLGNQSFCTWPTLKNICGTRNKMLRSANVPRNKKKVRFLSTFRKRIRRADACLPGELS